MANAILVLGLENNEIESADWKHTLPKSPQAKCFLGSGIELQQNFSKEQAND